MSSNDREAWIAKWQRDLNELQNIGRRRTRMQSLRRSAVAGQVVVDGLSLVNFGSNDYLGLSHHQSVIAAATQALEYGFVGSGASPLITGRGPKQALLEERLAAFEHTEAALILPTGFAANVAAITSLVGRGDAIYSDQLNHASIIDGCRLSGAHVSVYPHCDVTALRSMLKASRGGFRNALIVTDSLFSMDGDIAPIRELAKLAHEFNAIVLLDEAHATGVYGPTGAGLCEELSCGDEIFVRVGTLSKAIGCSGGFIVGPRDFIEVALHSGRSYMFSTAMPESMAAAAVEAINILQAATDVRTTLRQKSLNLRSQLSKLGLRISNCDSPIVPIYLGQESAVLEYSRKLRGAGFFVPAIRPPTVPEGQCLLRVSLTADHDQQSIDRLIAALGEIVLHHDFA